MSPEQARGEPITAASDVYAFGLVLQELLTGAPPHPQGLDTREQVGFMLGDLREKLSGVGRLDLMEEVGDQTLAYFENLPDEERTPDALARWSDALRLIGQMRIDQGDLAAAEDTFDQSLRVSRELVGLDPERSDGLLGLAHSHDWIGNVEWLRGEDDPALAALRRSIERKEELVAEDPTNAEWRTSLANGLSWLGSPLVERGDLAGALRIFETEGRMRRELVSKDTDRPGRRYLLAVNLGHEGRLRLLMGACAC